MTAWAVCLGGHDLEMVEIARLLAGRPDVAVFDRGLRWGAKATAYQSDITHALAGGRCVVLVELADDFPPDFPRDRLVWVDHHGPLAGADKPTAVEQLFALLAFPPQAWTRDLALVAANDRGHIAAMLAMGATAEEVRDTRTRDRRAQGVTERDEHLARIAITVAEPHFDGRLTVVRLPHSHTSAVTDFLHPSHGGPGYENLLVLCPAQTMFFGSGRCIDALRNAHPDGWFGGELPARGYWGVGRTIALSELLPLLESPIVTKPAIAVVIEKFHHILVWPLILRGCKADDIGAWITALDDAGWNDADPPGSTSVAADINYREVVYFHPFARDFLYADGHHTPDSRPLRRLTRKDVTRVQVTIGKRPLDLTVERAELYLCKPNVMLFCLEVSNKNVAGEYTPLMLDVVHDFRDQFRRVHPPFFTQPGKTSGQYDARDSTGAGLCPSEVKWTGLDVSPDAKCRLDSPKGEFDDFTREGAEPPVFAHWRVWFGNAIRPLPRLITDRPHEPKPSPVCGWRWVASPVTGLIRWGTRALVRGCRTIASAVRGLIDRLLCRRPTLYYQQIMDERMQCLSYLAAADPSEITDGDRDRLTFADAAGTDDFPYNREFLKRNRDAHTYTRFDSPEYQTAYFFCSYAFTALGRAREKYPFYSTHVLDHFRTLYYRMGIAAHFQRAALLYFSDEMSTAAKMLAGHSAASESEHRDYRDKLFAVQMQFIKFRSRSYFPEMTNQLQGQEMNRLWHTHLGIKELFDQVDRTCDQINEVYTQKAAERLSRVAAFFLPLSVGLSLLSVLFAGDFVPKYAALAESSDGVFSWANLAKLPHLLAVITLLVGGGCLLWGWRLRRKS